MPACLNVGVHRVPNIYFAHAEDLPQDVLARIFSHLATRDITNLAITSLHWQALALQPPLWRARDSYRHLPPDLLQALAGSRSPWRLAQLQPMLEARNMLHDVNFENSGGPLVDAGGVNWRNIEHIHWPGTRLGALLSSQSSQRCKTILLHVFGGIATAERDVSTDWHIVTQNSCCCSDVICIHSRIIW